MAKKRTDKKHKDKCECGMCGESGKDYAAWEAQMYAEYGFIMHFVTEHDDQSPSGFNSHTHGMDILGHPDFQITLPLSMEAISSFFHTMCNRVKKGEKFKHGDVIDDLCAGGYKVRLIEAEECERTVLRMVFADKNNCYMPSDMSKNEAVAQYGFSERE